MTFAAFASLSLLADQGPQGTLIALLVCGHTLGDFVFQTEEMVRRKHEVRWLVYHSLEVALLQGIFLIPYLSWTTLGVLAGIGVAHLAIDRLKVLAGNDASRAILYFALDQLLHLVVLGAAFYVLRRAGASLLPWFAPHASLLTVAAVGLAAYAFNLNGGAALVSLVLRSFALPAADDSEERRRTLRMGWMIGILERTLLLTLVLVDQWSALGLILAAKSFARFKDLDQRAFSEYYLIGTLTSVLIAILSGMTVKLLV